MPPAVERLAKNFMENPVVVSVGETGKSGQNIEQKVEFFQSEGRKKQRLIELVRTCDPPILIFVNTKKGCDSTSRWIESEAGGAVRSVVIHSGKSQEQREDHLEKFRSGKYDVLIATDVLGRGIDIKGVNHVINFELPSTIQYYTHRIGRTGRAGRTGTAWSFAMASDSELFFDLKLRLQESGARIPPEIANAKTKPGQAYGPAIVD
mmetsp:Transcript_8365/g.21980  ORF Transcript_8365/g.21980 Transcript_8365/m.21980 type:complete len:207 (+) Transcript_8365:1-621(+)